MLTKRISLISLIVILLAIPFFPLPVFADQPTADSPVKIMTLSDIHFDPFIACERQKPCALIQHLRAAPASQWATILAAEDHSDTRYKQNTNYWLLQSALQAAGEAALQQQVGLVLVLGDLLGHDYRRLFRYYSQDKSLADYQEFVRKTFEFLTGQMKKAFPRTSVYYAVGNNDSLYRDYINYPNDAFFSFSAKLFSPLILSAQQRADFEQQYARNGYYALTIPQADHLRLIVLNTNFLSSHAKLNKVANVPPAELNWLHAQLKMARAQQQKVIVAMHIPPSIDFYAASHYPIFTLRYLWKKEYITLFRQYLADDADIMAGVLVGHLHFDWLQFLSFGKNKIPLSGTPAVSPVFGNNPGFKIYIYSPQEHLLDDFLTYYYPLNSQRLWQLPAINDDVRQPFCGSCVAIDEIASLAPDSTLADYYQAIFSSAVPSPRLEKKWQSYYWCSIWGEGLDGVKKCLDPLQ